MTFFLTATAAITGIQACELHHSAKKIVKIFNKYFRAKEAVLSKKEIYNSDAIAFPVVFSHI